MPTGSRTLDCVFAFGSNTVAKAHAHACLIHNCFLSRDASTLVCDFTTYVRPLLESCFAFVFQLKEQVLPKSFGKSALLPPRCRMHSATVCPSCSLYNALWNITKRYGSVTKRSERCRTLWNVAEVLWGVAEHYRTLWERYDLLWNVTEMLRKIFIFLSLNEF